MIAAYTVASKSACVGRCRRKCVLTPGLADLFEALVVSGAATHSVNILRNKRMVINNHPFIPQNVYRMSGGAANNERFEQIGQSWGKHAFAAASSNTCGFGCNGVGGDHLGSGCSDAYGAGLSGNQDGIGSRAWVNPFTGSFPGSTANNHSGHNHDVTSHRILVDVNDLNTSLNVGATYFAEAEYIVPHEY